MTLAVTSIPGTNVGYILATSEQLTEPLDAEPVDVPGVGKVMPYVTEYGEAMRAAGKAGWTHLGDDTDEFLVHTEEGHLRYLTLLKRKARS